MRRRRRKRRRRRRRRRRREEEEEEGEGEGEGGFYSAEAEPTVSFAGYQGVDALRALRGGLDSRGRREYALTSALDCLLNARSAHASTAAAARLPPLPPPPSAPSLTLPWLPEAKETLSQTLACPSCARRIGPTGGARAAVVRAGLPNALAEHVFTCAHCGPTPAGRTPSNGGSRDKQLARADRRTPVQRMAMRLLALELLIPAPFLRVAWAARREQWRELCIKACNAAAAPASADDGGAAGRGGGAAAGGAATALAQLATLLEASITRPSSARAGAPPATTAPTGS